MRRKQRNRFFILAFAFSFFVLGMLGMVVVFTLNPVEEDLPSTSISADGTYLPRQEDNLSVLLMGKQADGVNPAFFALVKLSMTSGEIPVLLFPVDTALLAETGFASLREAYLQGGPQKAAEALSKSYSVPVDRYADGTMDAFHTIIGRIGVVEFVLDNALSYQENDVSIQLSAGKQLVDGQKFYDILRYPTFSGDALTHSLQAARLLEGYLNTHFGFVLGENANRQIGGMLNLVQTNLSIVDFEKRIAAFWFLKKLNPSPAKAYGLSGGWNSENLFLPDASAREELLQLFG